MGILESRWLDLLRLAVVVHALYSSVTIRLFAVEHHGALPAGPHAMVFC